MNQQITNNGLCPYEFLFWAPSPSDIKHLTASEYTYRSNDYAKSRTEVVVTTGFMTKIEQEWCQSCSKDNQHFWTS